MAAKKPAARKTYAKKDKGPSRTDIQTEEIEKDIIEFWKAIADNKLQSWNKPWVYNFALAENAGKFLNTGERYVYKGGFNQFLIAHAAASRDSDRGMLVLNRTDMAKLFSTEQFGDSPVVKNGIKSIGSIYNRPVEKTVAAYYVYPSGARWSGDTPTAKPTQAQIDSLSLSEKKIKKLVFDTFPVWSAHDIYDVLPDEHKAKIDELVALRVKKGFDFNPEDDIQKHIDNLLNDITDRQAIKVNVGGDRAFYMPDLDQIGMPEKSKFKNPVVHYGTSIHELSHATMHLASRNPSSKNKVEYAIEEVVAETTAVMMVKNLEKSLADVLPLRPDIQEMFDNYYKSSMTYNHGWGEKFDFAAGVKTIEHAKSEDKSIVKTILVNVAKSVDILQNGVFTPELRAEAKLNNFKRAFEKSKSAELTI